MSKSYLEQKLEDLEAEIKSKSRDELLEMGLKDKKISKLADSYNLEEGIYNLLHLYKTFHSRKNILVVCGWQ